MKTIVKNMLFIIGMMISTTSFGATCTAISNGNWSNPATWSCGSVPGCGDIIIVPAGIQVDVNIQVDLDENSSPFCSTPVQIIIFGTLEMQNGRKIYLSCGSTIEVMVGGKITYVGGGGSSNAIYICDDEMWTADSGPITGHVLLGTPTTLPTTLVTFNVSIYNEQLKANWTVESERMVDHYSVEVSNDYSNWNEVATKKSVGDHSSTQDYSIAANVADNSATYVRLIAKDLDGNSQILDTRSINSLTFVEVYPNPATPSDNIKMSGLESGTVIIFDQQGSIVAETDIENSNLNTSEVHLKQGIYFIKIIESGQMIRLLIQ